MSIAARMGFSQIWFMLIACPQSVQVITVPPVTFLIVLYISQEYALIPPVRRRIGAATNERHELRYRRESSMFLSQSLPLYVTLVIYLHLRRFQRKRRENVHEVAVPLAAWANGTKRDGDNGGKTSGQARKSRAAKFW